MNKLGFFIISIALVLNIVVASMGGLQNSSDVVTDDPTEKVPPGNDFVASNITGVTVPQLSIYDMARYDNRIYAAQHSENLSSGEWDRIEIIALGQTTELIGAVEDVQDGFFQSHECVAKESITTGTIEFVYTNDTGGLLSLGGTINMDRTEYWDIVTMRPVAVTNGGGITISGLGALIGEDFGERGELAFSGDVRSWPDLRKEYVLSLEDRIYGSGQELNIGDSGTIYQTNEDNGYNTPYNWEIEQGLVIGGEETVEVNITSSFWDFLPYSKQIWVSSNISMPARVRDYTNISWGYEGSTFEDEGDEEDKSDDAGYIVIEQDRTLKNDGWTQGEDLVPWEGELGDQTPDGYFLDISPHGEFQPWYDNMMPVGGDNYESSSFNFKPEELTDIALNMSTGFQEFVDTYDDVTISRGETNATFTSRDGTEGEFWWTVYFRHKPTEAEAEAAWEAYEASGYEDFDAPWTYWMQVKKTVEDTGGIVGGPSYTTTYEVYNESIRDSWSTSGNNKYDYPDSVLTMAGFESIIRLDNETVNRCYDDGELMWNKDPAIFPEDDDYTSTMLEVSGEEGDDGFMDMITMITGLSLPSYDFAWSHNRGWTGYDGYQYSVSVDAENGQLLGTMYVEGTQFMALFM